MIFCSGSSFNKIIGVWQGVGAGHREVVRVARLQLLCLWRSTSFVYISSFLKNRIILPHAKNLGGLLVDNNNKVLNKIICYLRKVTKIPLHLKWSF